MTRDRDHDLAGCQARPGLKEIPERDFQVVSDPASLSCSFAKGYLVRIDASVQRTWLGDTPAHRRKCRARWLWSEKPVARAISDNGARVSRSMCSTCCKRRRNKYVWGGTPIDWWNARAK